MAESTTIRETILKYGTSAIARRIEETTGRKCGPTTVDYWRAKNAVPWWHGPHFEEAIQFLKRAQKPKQGKKQ